VAFLFSLLSAPRRQNRRQRLKKWQERAWSLQKFVALTITRQNRPGDFSSISDVADMRGTCVKKLKVISFHTKKA
jgi:hypothetical protein